MKLFFALLFTAINLSQVRLSQSLHCETQRSLSGVISHSQYGAHSRCWIIEVPEGSYTRLNIQTLSMYQDCSRSYVRITVAGTGEMFTFCYGDANRKPITALSDVNITAVNTVWNHQYSLQLTLNYSTESLICAQQNHFRCSNHSCIHEYLVCNGVKDCENGEDEIGCETGVAAVKGVNISRENGIKWLKSERSALYGWGRNTHRAVTALYLSEAASFDGNDLEEELNAKQLELQTSIALLRNSSDPLSVNELSMFINGLSVTCHNPRQFYGYDLLQILSERITSSKSVSPGPYLTLCNANWTISDSQTRSLINILHKNSEYPFLLDVQAMATMALTCIKNRTKTLDKIINATQIYDATLKKFISNQLTDGSFGNSYTTALVTQALLSGGQENNKMWNLTSTVHYLMKQLNSSTDFLLTYLTLPIFNSRSLVDIATVDCSNNPRKQRRDEEISDVLNKLGGKMRIQFSLYVGDQKDIIHTIYLRIPENSSVYDVMRVAEVADPKYKFQHRDVSGRTYIYEIAGITNDPEAGMFWILYTMNPNSKDKVQHHTESPDKYILKDNEHLIMWYKTVHI